MSILDVLGKIVIAPGVIVLNQVDEIASGGVINHKTVSFEGNAFEAKAILEEHGIKAFAPMNGFSISRIEVHKGNKKEAIKVLRRNGFDCW